jgi:3-hydroxybutyryl-CoA dehydrogenase
VKPNPIQRVAVLGAGTMGHGIAQVCAMSGYTVVLYDVDPLSVDAGLDRIGRNLEKGVELGKVADATRESALAALRPTTDLGEAVDEAELVVEAVPERMELKRELFASVESRVPSDVLLATNTSSLSVGSLAEGLDHPGRFLGLHFFNPVHVMELVEVVRGPQTSDATLDRAVKLVVRLGREPIVVQDSPGFASSRLGVVLGLEAMRMLEEGVASAEDIDKAMQLGYRHPMGPLKLTDLVGLDVRLGIARYLHEALDSEAFRPPAILERMVDEGLLGRKSGRGFYTWTE